MITDVRQNLWSITIVARADGSVTVIPVEAPMEIHRKVVQLLRTLPLHVSAADVLST